MRWDWEPSRTRRFNRCENRKGHLPQFFTPDSPCTARNCDGVFVIRPNDFTDANVLLAAVRAYCVRADDCRYAMGYERIWDGKNSLWKGWARVYDSTGKPHTREALDDIAALVRAFHAALIAKGESHD